MSQPNEARLCSKCKKNPASGEQPWCKPCRAQYQREYQATVEDKSKNRGFYEGVQATKDLLAREFFMLGPATLTGPEIAGYIERAPGPKATD